MVAALAGCGGGGDSSAAPSAPPVNNAPTVALTAPLANTTFASGAQIELRATAADADGTVAKVEFYAGAAKLGEATAAPFTYRWVGAPVGAHTVTARATDDDGAVATSATVVLNVDPPVVPNAAPTVAIVAPANGFKPNAPATLTWVAQADDSDGSIAAVEFFRVNPAAIVLDATTRIGAGARQGNTSAYGLQVTGWAAGNYAVVARAIDDDGAPATSATVQVIVNALPTIAFAAPANNSSHVAGTDVTLRVNAADSDGSITKVEFFLDASATPLGAGVVAPPATEHRLAWRAAAPGAHTIEARATDNDGAVRSVSISIAVSVPPNVPPTVTLAVPVDGANAPVDGASAPVTITLSAVASDSDGTIASVVFRRDGVAIGNGARQGSTDEYRLTLPNRPAGTYNLSATATDDDGAPSTTPSRIVTVAANVPPTVSVAAATTSLELPASVVLTATAADTSDGIASVEFFAGGTSLGVDTSLPYSLTWTPTTAGDYLVTARATDGYGSTTTSAATTVTVLPNPVGMWSTLSTAQKAGFATATPAALREPNRPIGDPAVDAVEVLTAIGPNTVIPKFQPAMADAVRTLATFTPTTVSTTAAACPGGGTVLVSSGATLATPNALRYQYIACKVGLYTFTGGVDYTHIEIPPLPALPIPRNIGSAVYYLPNNTGGFRLLLEGVKVSGNGAPEPEGERYPRNALIYSFADCTGSGVNRSCMTNLDVNAVWGTDLSWTHTPGLVPTIGVDDTYTLSGVQRSHYCSPDFMIPDQGRANCLASPPASRHLRFQAMTQNSGRAIVYGNNGYSVVTRLAPAPAPEIPGTERVSVLRTFTVATPGFPVGTDPAAAIYRCNVGSTSGDWACRSP